MAYAASVVCFAGFDGCGNRFAGTNCGRRYSVGQENQSDTDDNAMTVPRLFIVHGFMAAPEHHWFPWLQQVAEQAGVVTEAPQLPESHSPQLSHWLESLESVVGEPDENTWLVGHSLGCITLLNYLNQRYPQAVTGGMILVSGFSEAVPGLEMLADFVRQPVDNHRIISNVRQRAVIASLNDTIVPAAFSLRLSQQLAAPFYGIPDSGHFLGREGVTELPLVASLLQQFWSQSAAGHIPA
ncbi:MULTISPECIES: alpha/beta fold hydrolase [unclassified Tatumella]|uniref:RBBP9/YdeN family alpha/beta hydrolase n=1 Tax=unclassified Tatumella TaxID=2649542 RepID=UPI001BB0B3EB|nr:MULTISPECIES: alpha/beta fold hydrolase [unclassified Tatumella]MBS0878476.1 alpha/beta hydrolase [Tatumella sp. JGM82]MBS0891991.1 alpha/beta hydrolase [Tatumella sp. JGM94]MBS0903109.1 alpha/beta hydrolase [Tatumella sp. JGM100]